MPRDDSTAVACLICGILSWMFCPVVLAIVAIVLGSGHPSGLAKAGVILGWLNIIMLVGGFVLFLLFSIGGILLSFTVL